MLYLTEADVEQVLDFPSAIAAVAEAFRQLAAGKVENVSRARAAARGAILHVMSAAGEYLGFSCWKAYLTTRAGARFHVGLYDHHAGELVALIQADRLGQIRTGATTAVAVDHLAPRDLAELGLFGTGWQAESQLTAIAAVRTLKRALVHSRDSRRRADFAQRMQAGLGFEVIPAETAERACQNLPLVVTATTSATPVFDGRWLTPGTLVCPVGSNWLRKAEVDAETIRRAGTIVCDSIECCRREAGDFVEAIDRGFFDWARAVELAELLSGRATVPHDPSAITLFKSVGMAIEDLAVATLVYQRAGQRGLGRQLDL